MPHAETIAAYDAHANEIANMLDTRRPRDGLIEYGLNLAGNPVHAVAVEVGCGAGRDAGDIISRVSRYEGFDPSQAMIAIARQRYPSANFTVADATSYQYPEGVDVVYGFASFVHLDRDEFERACQRISDALNPSGAVVMSLREADQYERVAEEDEFGARLFHNYDITTVQKLAGPRFDVRCLARLSFRQRTYRTPWMFLSLQRR